MLGFLLSKDLLEIVPVAVCSDDKVVGLADSDGARLVDMLGFLLPEDLLEIVTVVVDSDKRLVGLADSDGARLVDMLGFLLPKDLLEIVSVVVDWDDIVVALEDSDVSIFVDMLGFMVSNDLPEVVSVVVDSDNMVEDLADSDEMVVKEFVGSLSEVSVDFELDFSLNVPMLVVCELVGDEAPELVKEVELDQIVPLLDCDEEYHGCLLLLVPMLLVDTLEAELPVPGNTSLPVL